jgi:hypothetical protein
MNRDFEMLIRRDFGFIYTYMAKQKSVSAKLPGKKRTRSVAVDEQNPASTDVQSLIKTLGKRKKTGRKKP